MYDVKMASIAEYLEKYPRIVSANVEYARWKAGLKRASISMSSANLY